MNNADPIQEIEPREAQALLSAGGAVLVDVREPDEQARERIAGARLVPLSRFDPRSFPEHSTLIIHCQRGGRSMDAARRAAASGRRTVMSVKGGIEAWRRAGLPTERDARAPLPIMRQVQIVVGAAVLVCSVLAAFVSPWFLLLTGFFGAGLLFAGLSGMCGIAAVLSRMPWNRVKPPMNRRS